jgi:cytochrome c2
MDPDMFSNIPFRGLVAAGVIVLAAPGWIPGANAQATAADFNSHCTSCHSAQAGKNGIGPSLAGVYGRPSGTAPGYAYSPAMKNAHIVWDQQALDKFLQNPPALVHGTKMFTTVPDAGLRQHIIAYLQGLKPQAAAK